MSRLDEATNADQSGAADDGRLLDGSQDLWQTTFDRAPAAMTMSRVLVDGTRRFERVNAAFADLVARDADALIGIDPLDLVHGDDRGAQRRLLDEILAAERNAAVSEQRHLRPDGTFAWTLTQMVLIDRGDEVRVLCHVVDIEDRRARDEQRDQLSLLHDRERIARDLHDLVIQRLFGAGLRLQAVIPDMGADVAVDRTIETIDELDTAIRELRSAIFSLQRRGHARSVTDAVDDVIDQHVERLGFRPVRSLVGPVESLSSVQSHELLSTLREGLSNIARHAQAASCDVRIEVGDEAVTLTVCDDGRGIDAANTAGNGLFNMADRARRLGGSSRIERGASGGSELVWQVPR